MYSMYNICSLYFCCQVTYETYVTAQCQVIYGMCMFLHNVGHMIDVSEILGTLVTVVVFVS